MTTQQQAKIEYSDLDIKLKIAIITAWIIGVLCCLAFLGGFFNGLNG